MQKVKRFIFGFFFLIVSNLVCITTSYAVDVDTIAPGLSFSDFEYQGGDFSDDEADFFELGDTVFSTYDCTPAFPDDYFTIIPIYSVSDENSENVEVVLDTMIVNELDVSVSQYWYAEDNAGNRTTKVFTVGWEPEQAHQPIVNSLKIGGNSGDPFLSNEFEFCEGVPINITYNDDNNCSDQLSYRWHEKGEINAFSNQKLMTFEDLPVGTHEYELKIRGDFFGGFLDIDFLLEVFPAPHFEIDSVDCEDDCNGGIEVVSEGDVDILSALTFSDLGSPISDQLSVTNLCTGNYTVNLTTTECTMEKSLTVAVKKDIVPPVLEFNSSDYELAYTGFDGEVPNVSFDESSKTLFVDVMTCDVEFPYSDFLGFTIIDCDESVQVLTNDIIDEENISVRRTYQAIDGSQNISEYHVVISFAETALLYQPKITNLMIGDNSGGEFEPNAFNFCEGVPIGITYDDDNSCSDNLSYRWRNKGELNAFSNNKLVEFDSLPPGLHEYELRVSGDLFGGFAEIDFALSVVSSASVEIDSVDCLDACNGEIRITPNPDVNNFSAITFNESNSFFSDELIMNDLCADNYVVELATSDCFTAVNINVPVKSDAAPILKFDTADYKSLYTSSSDEIQPELSYDEQSKTLTIQVKSCELAFPYLEFPDPEIVDCDKSASFTIDEIIDVENLLVQRNYTTIDANNNSSNYAVVVQFAPDGTVYSPVVESVNRIPAECESNHLDFFVTAKNQCSDSLEFNWFIDEISEATGTSVEIDFPGNGEYQLEVRAKGVLFGKEAKFNKSVSVDGVEFSKTITDESCLFPGEAKIDISLADPDNSSFSWCDSTEGTVKENLTSGAYCFTVFDSIQQCEIQDTIVINKTLDIPVAEFTINNLNPIRLSDEVEILNNSDADEQFWLFGDEEASTSIAATLVHTYSETGEYTITLTAKNGTCSDTMIREIVIEEDLPVEIESSINDAWHSQSIKLFPNPANEMLNIQMVQDLTGRFTYSLISLDGIIQLQGELYMEGSGMFSSVEIAGLESGIYYLILIDKKVRITEKFIIVKDKY